MQDDAGNLDRAKGARRRGMTEAGPFGTVRWFGQSWHAPVCDPRNRVAAPVGERCSACHIALTSNDQGVTIPHYTGAAPKRAAWHLRCWIGEVLGDSTNALLRDNWPPADPLAKGQES